MKFLKIVNVFYIIVLLILITINGLLQKISLSIINNTKTPLYLTNNKSVIF